jgi:predicted dehydrogenase
MSQQQPLVRVGVIGLGAIGERMIQGFLKHTNTEVTAVCDVSETRVVKVAESLGGIEAYTSHLDLLAKSSADLVYVAVPPALHHQIVLDVIAAGKHVLCEKPLANTLDEARAMLVRAQGAGTVHALNFPLHYSAEVRAFQRLLSEGYIGSLRRIHLITHFPMWPRRWQQNEWVGGRKQGGFILEVGVHFIETLQRLFGEIVNVRSTVGYPLNPDLCETDVLATMELKDGTPILFSGISNIPGDEHIEFTAYGSKGMLSLLNWGLLKGAVIGETPGAISVESDDSGDLITNVVQSIIGHPADLCDFQVGYNAQVVLEQLRGQR